MTNTKTKLQNTLAKLAPSINIETIWEPDRDATWDIEDDTLDPNNFEAWQSEIKASAVVNGSLISGSAHLCGTWEKIGDDPAQSNPEISGYEMQMTEEAIQVLKGQAFNQALRDQCGAAITYLKEQMRERYESQKRKGRGKQMKRSELTDPFLRGYLDAALFTTDEHPPSGCDYVESGRTDELYPSLPEDFLSQAKADCARFEAENAELLKQAGDHEQNGADFWFTRNGHGVGFWDRGYPDEVADPLTAAAKKFGEHDLILEITEEKE